MVSPNPYPGTPGDEPAPSAHPVTPPPPPGYGPPPAAGYTPPPGAGYTPPPAGGYTPPPFGGPMGGAPGMPPVNAVPQPGNLIDRFVARFIDGVIVGVTSTIISFGLGIASNSWLLTGLISSVVTAALWLGYFTYLESSRGQTIGKQLMKLKVVGPDHVSNPTMEQAARRNIWTAFGIAGVVPIIGGILGGLAELGAVILIALNINSDPQRQHWFDKFAGGTQVLKIG